MVVVTGATLAALLLAGVLFFVPAALARLAVLSVSGVAATLARPAIFAMSGVAAAAADLVGGFALLCIDP